MIFIDVRRLLDVIRNRYPRPSWQLHFATNKPEEIFLSRNVYSQDAIVSTTTVNNAIRLTHPERMQMNITVKFVNIKDITDEE